MHWFDQTQPTSIVAVVTTVHLCLLLLRWHRSVSAIRHAPLLVPSGILSAVPWLLPSPAWLIASVLGHLGWFAAGEKYLHPVGSRAAHMAAGPVPRAAVPSQSAAPRTAAHRPPTVQAQAGNYIDVPVLAVFQETEDIRTFRLARPSGFEFKAGQFLTVRAMVEGRPLVRCYSISSSPLVPGYLEISVKKQGQVSSVLHATVRPGTMLSVRPPGGVFTYPNDDARPIVCLAGGVGITPLMSMLRYGVVSEPTRPIVLLLAVRNHKQVPYRRELDYLQERHPHLTVAVLVQEGPCAAGHIPGMITEPVIVKTVPDPQNSIFMICGPPPMLTAMKGMLAGLDVPETQVRHEVFEAAVALAEAPARQSAASHRTEAEQLPAANCATVTLSRTGIAVEVPPTQTLLEAAEASGVAIPSMCRAGVCLTCRTRVLSGDVECSSDALDQSDLAAGYVLPCVSWARGDCVLDA